MFILNGLSALLHSGPPAGFALLLPIMLIIRRTPEWKHPALFMCVRLYECCVKACFVQIRVSAVLFRNAHSAMCRVAWLNWIMPNLYALWECLRCWKMTGGRVMKWGCKGLVHSEWAEKMCVCVLVCVFERGARFALFSHFFLCRSTSECGHGYRSGQHWSHFWS